MRETLIVLALAASFCVSKGGIHPDGASKVSREQDALGNYKFSYSVSNAEGEHFREEGTDREGRVVGTYGLTHRDGRQRVVDYVADKDGFRAEVRSNEPGLASSEAGDARVLKLGPDHTLSVAATDVDSSRSAFGTRLNSDDSRVSYVGEGGEEPPPRRVRVNDAAREPRQRNFGDYRPRNPVAYYPADAARNPQAPQAETQGQRRPRKQDLDPAGTPERETADSEKLRSAQDPAVESRPRDTYIPPLDPNSALRPYIDPSSRFTERRPPTSERPYIPPYGGFDDDPPLVDGIGQRPDPEDSLAPIRGGLGRDRPSPPYGSGRYPSSADLPLSRDFIRPEFPPALSPPRIQRPLSPPVTRSVPSGGSIFPPGGVGRGPPGFFSPPSFDPGRTPERFVLRAVPIPNGIQAVRVDPETGRVFERVLYPLYLTRDGRPEFDRNALLHYDVDADGDPFRNDERRPGFDDDDDGFPSPFRGRSPFRAARTANLDDQGFRNRSRRLNGSFPDPGALGLPTARDRSWIRRQLALVEEFDGSRLADAPFPRSDDRDPEFPLFNDFDDSSDEGVDREDSPYARDRTLERRDFSRNPRHFDRLQPEDTKAIIVSESKTAESESKTAETVPGAPS